MIYSLVLATALGLQTVGSYTNSDQCKIAAEEWRAQGVKAGCVQQESPEQAINKMTALMKNMMDQMNDGKR